MTIKPIRLDDWSVVSKPSPYQAPEDRKIRLRGFARNDPRRSAKNGYGTQKHIVTSAIAGVDGRIITTVNGTVYELGDVSAEYMEYLRDNSWTYDPVNPIRDRRFHA